MLFMRVLFCSQAIKMETSEESAMVFDVIETENLNGPNINSKTSDNPKISPNSSSDDGEIEKSSKASNSDASRKATPLDGTKSNTVDEIQSNAVNETLDKENDEWEVVEASSDESDASTCSEYDIKIPLRFVENPKDSTDAPVLSLSTSENNIKVELNSSDCIIIDPTPEKNIHQPIQKELNIHERNIDPSNINEKNIHPLTHNIDESSLNDKNTKQSTEPTQNQTSLTNNQKSQSSANSNIRKRKKRLYTGDSSDDDDTTVRQTGSQGIKYVPEINKRNDNAQGNVQSKTYIEENNPSFSNNQTFVKEKTKFHSDTEITAEDNFTSRHKYPSRQCSSKTAKLHDITERDSDDEDILVIPRSPHANTSHHFMIPAKKETLRREKSSHSHDCHCSSGALLGSPNSKRAKRQKLMQQMWQEKERKLKQKMVKKLKNVFFQVLESIVTSSDESDDSSVSEEEDKKINKMMRMKKQPCRKQCCVQSHHAQDKEFENMKRELDFWKNKFTNVTQVLSPEELQIREMKADLKYWKRLATSKSSSQNVASSSHAIPKTSTPEKVNDIFTEIPSMSRAHETSRVSSSADISTHISQHSNHPRQVEYTSDEDVAPNPYKHRSQSSSHKHKPADALSDARKALNVMSRTKMTEKEKNQIVEYLISHYDTLELLKGNMFWMQMAHDLNTHRSWHSLRNNFFQNIIKNLELYEMPNKVRNKIISLAKNYM